MSRVLFIGDINVDVMMGGMPSPPIVDREVPCKTFEVVMGASTVISACAYASLGGQVSFAGLAGEDDYGEFMLRGLHGFGIDTALVRRTRAVRTGVTVNMISGNTRTQATYPGTIEAYDGQGLDHDDTLRPFRHLHFGGVGLETALRPRITAILAAAKRLGISTSMDYQWDSTERWERLDEWLPPLTYLFANEDEAMSMTRAATPEDACRILSARANCALVKTGRRGALAFIDGKVVAVPTRLVTPVDTTGAGDSFDSGFLYARLEKNFGLLDAVRFANAVAARSCTFTGGTEARTTYDQALEFML